MTGRFLVILPAKALRLYVVDLMGDAREEVVVLDEAGVIKIFADDGPAPEALADSPWKQQHYRRQKQNWNKACIRSRTSSTA